MNHGPVEILIILAIIAGCVWLVTTAVSIVPDDRGFGTHEQLDMEPCSYYQRTGHPCFSCGMTTSFAYMVRMRPIRAFRASPAGSLLCILALITPGWMNHALITGQHAFRFLLHRRAPWVIPGAVLGVLASWAYKVAAASVAGFRGRSTCLESTRAASDRGRDLRCPG